jgi:hypothetical protein
MSKAPEKDEKAYEVKVSPIRDGNLTWLFNRHLTG